MLRTRTLVHRGHRSHLAWNDDISGPRPGVVVFPEWWGLDEHPRQRAERLAADGYIALAGDLYGDGLILTDPAEAAATAGKLRADIPAWRARARAALDALAGQPECDGTRLAAIGYCLGGSTALQLAFSGAPIRAAVSYHGGLPTPTRDELAGMRATLLVCHGGADPFVSKESVASFRSALDTAGVEYTFVAYEGAKHSFGVPDAEARAVGPLAGNMAYDPAADADSWERTRKLLAAVLAAPAAA